jgi:UDP-N-acetylglucosamine--N-acetylmuramyl-(pentapeptide) pyrophosphoryl-undecaprenol N-acetylglucosamine transferase
MQPGEHGHAGVATAPNSPHVVFAGGGTGGHLFPGLATADALTTLLGNVRITFAGSGAAFERRHVTAAGNEYITLRSRPLRSSPWAWPGFLAAHWQGRRQALEFLRERRVDLVVGLGGYTSVPMTSAAATRGIPLVLLEQNAIPGRANRWLARYATSICLGFECAGRHFRQVAADRLLVTGTPLRVIPEESEPATSLDLRPLLVICGGSGGARPLNLALPRVLARI